MKLHNLILLFLLVSSLPITAEEPNIWDDFLGLFSSGDKQDEECDETTTAERVAEGLRAEICPNFLMSQSTSRDQKTMIFSDTSADKNCKFIPKDRSFNNNQSFETYLKNKEPFSEINATPIADCMSHPFPVGSGRNKRNKTLPEDKHKILITEYYLTQHRLEAGLKNTLHDITAIDQLIGNPILNGIQCNGFQSISNISEECNSLQQCSPPSVDLGQSAEETIQTMKAITAIDEEIDKLEGSWFSGDAEKNKEKIQELKERKAGLISLYPWVAGKIFQDGYKDNSRKEEVIRLIKEQLAYTRTRLKKNLGEMQHAVSCTRYNNSCKDLNFDKVMAKTPPIDTDSIFQRNKISSMSDKEVQSLSPEQKTKLKKDLMAHNYFSNAQCRQEIRENVSEVRKDLGFLALDVGLTIATVGLGSAAIAGRLAVRAGTNISKAQRLQNLGLMGVDVTFSIPHINRAIDRCDDYMNQLEQTASEETSNVCKKLPVRSKLTSDLKRCLLTASLASLPLVIPALGVAGRAGYLAMKGRKGGTSPPAPNSPNPPTKPTPPPKPETPKISLLPKPPGRAPTTPQGPPRPPQQAPAQLKTDSKAIVVRQTDAPPASSARSSNGGTAVVRTEPTNTSAASRTDSAPKTSTADQTVQALPAPKNQPGRRTADKSTSGASTRGEKPSTSSSSRSTDSGTSSATPKTSATDKAIQALSVAKSQSGRTAGRKADEPSSGASKAGAQQAKRQGENPNTGQKTRPDSNAQAGNSSTRARASQRTRNRFHSLRDSENRAGRLSKRILHIINKNSITKKGKNSIGDYLVQARTHLKQQNPRLNDTHIAKTIARDLRQQGANIQYTKGNFRVTSDEGVFIINSSGKIRKVNPRATARTSSTGRAVQTRSTAKPPTTDTSRSGAVVLRSQDNNRGIVPRARANGQQTRNRNTTRHKPSPRQHIASTGARTARSINPPKRSARRPDRLVPRSIQAGVVARNAITAGAGGIAGSAAADADSNAENSDSAIETENADSSNNNRGNSQNEDGKSDRERRKKEKKDNWDCSQYAGGNPQNRREMICYYYMRAAQLEEETKQIRQRTQALNNFKTQVWSGIKENQVPSNFFTNNSLQKHIQDNKGFMADYLNSFRLMYDISRIQEQYLTPNDRNRLRQIIQDTDQYMNSPNLDGYSHIRESIHILLNRLQVPVTDQYFKI